MSDSNYHPFPESELEQLAKWHDSAAKMYPDSTFTRGLHEDRAQACREAIKHHTALRERMLVAETENCRLRGLLPPKERDHAAD